jgi:hypothetical protein
MGLLSPKPGNSESQTIDLTVLQPAVFTTDSTGYQQPKMGRGAITEEILYIFLIFTVFMWVHVILDTTIFRCIVRKRR